MGGALSGYRRAEPNPAHMALAKLNEMGLLQAVVTQNVDGAPGLGTAR